MYKRIISLLCAFTIIGSFNVTDCSTAAVVQPVAPAYSYTSNCTSTLLLSGSTLTCDSYIEGYYNITDKIVVYQYLQRKNASNEWVTIYSWYNVINNHIGSVINYRYSVASGSYRLKTTFDVYSGTNYETITKYSKTKTI
ncbi:MAG: hypothetical protein IKI94_06910 [Ruminococcus sp.]|nr:hypothetical protein [Ruminococcus sp.]